MSVRYTDVEIRELIQEPKKVKTGFFDLGSMLDRGGYERADLSVVGENGSRFVVKLRRSKINPLDFSVILGVEVPGTNIVFRLRRYNGHHAGKHRNKIEKNEFRAFHVHTATQRYQERGFKEDAFAEETDRYGTLQQAIDCMMNDCGFFEEGDRQLRLFDE